MADPVPPPGYQIVTRQQSGGMPPPPPDGFVLDPKSMPQQGPMSWGDVATGAVMNLPSSAYNIAQGIAHAVMHPIDTAQGIYDIGKGAVSKVEGALGVQQDPSQKAGDEAAINAVRDFYVNRYGSLEGFKKALAEDPAGVAMDVSTVFTGPEMALSRTPGALGKAGEISGRVADLTNPVSLAGKLATNVGEPVLSNVLGQTTGVGAQPIRQAARAGAEGDMVFPANMRGDVPLTDTIDMAKGAVGQMRKERSDAYNANMATTVANKAPLYFDDIYNAIADGQQIAKFNGKIKSDDAASVLDKIKSKVDEWRSDSPPGAQQGPDGWVAISPFRTAEGFDALKQAIGDIRDSTQYGTKARRVADLVYNAAKNTIVKQSPDYADAMKGYSTASDQIKELEKTFSLGEKASKDTALRKLQSSLRNNVNTNYGQRTAQMNSLADYAPDLPNALAGQAMTSATPRGLAGIGAITLGGGGVAMHGLPALMNPAALALLPAFSPRMVGEGAYAAGRAGNALMPVAQYIPDAVKAGYIVNALSQPRGLVGGIGPRYDENGNLRPGQ